MSTTLWYQKNLIIHKIRVDPFLKTKLDGCLWQSIGLELHLLNILKQLYALAGFLAGLLVPVLSKAKCR